LGGKITDKQVRKLMAEMTKKPNKRFAAMKAGMDRRTAAKYLQLGKLPSELPPVEHVWRTRGNPFEPHWPEVENWLKNAPELEAKFLFDHLCEKYPGAYQEGQLRTLQRHIKQWRAIEGPDKEVFFSQQHYPGRLMQTDFTHMNSLRVTIRGEEFKHMFCHCVLTYSNWEWGRICFSESYEAIKLGVQSTLVKLGRIPEKHRTDGTTAATHLIEKGKKGRRDFNGEYKTFMDHFGMKPETVNDPNHKSFIFTIMEKANTLRSKRLGEELAVMRELPINRLPLYTETEEKVRPSSTVRVKKNVYSVPSRLVGERVTARVYEDKVYILYAGKLQLEVERLRGSGGKCINYRHIIWSLVNKPGAFENYKYRQELFPTIHFRKTYDALRDWYSPFNANKEYLRILYYAATTMESEVETALVLLMEGGAMFSSDHVKELLGARKRTAPIMTVPRVNLAEYNILLKEAVS